MVPLFLPLLLAGATVLPRQTGTLSNARLGTDAASREANRQAVAAMDTRALTSLRAARIRFEGLPAAEQQRLREFHTALLDHPRSKSLQQVLLHYVEWIRTLDENRRAQLEDMPPAERLAELCRTLFATQHHLELLSPADQAAYDKWFLELARDRADEVERVIDSLPVASKLRSGAGLPATPEGRLRLALLAARPEQLEAVAGADAMKNLRERLSAGGQWIASLHTLRKAVKITVTPPSMSRIILQQFFNSLGPREQAELDRLPSEERTGRLRKVYLRAQMDLDQRRPGD